MTPRRNRKWPTWCSRQILGKSLNKQWLLHHLKSWLPWNYIFPPQNHLPPNSFCKANFRSFQGVDWDCFRRGRLYNWSLTLSLMLWPIPGNIRKIYTTYFLCGEVYIPLLMPIIVWERSLSNWKKSPSSHPLFPAMHCSSSSQHDLLKDGFIIFVYDFIMNSSAFAAVYSTASSQCNWNRLQQSGN